MADRRKFRCPQCGHSELDTIPHRPRCPQCGSLIPRPERAYVITARRRRTASRPPI